MPLPPQGPTGSIPYSRVRTPVRLHYASADRKLSPVEMRPYDGPGNRTFRPIPVGPYCAATYTSIDATCPSSCRFKAAGCYVRAGFTGRAAELLDEVGRGMDPERVADAEVKLLDAAFGAEGGRGPRIPQDGARGGRDLRLHVGGDVPSTAGAQRLACAARRWMQRGGGRVWTYTHRWREIERATFGAISVLASVETPAEARAADLRGYVPALVVESFPSRRAFHVEGLRLKVIPCPAETGGADGGVTCVSCRLCLDDGALRRRGAAIGFALHGLQREHVQLPVLETRAA